MGGQILAAHQGPRNTLDITVSPHRLNLLEHTPRCTGPSSLRPSLPPFSHPWGLSLPSQAPKQELDRLRGGTGLPVHPASAGTRRRRHRPLMALGFGSRARTAPLAPKVTPARNRARARARTPLRQASLAPARNWRGGGEGAQARERKGGREWGGARMRERRGVADLGSLCVAPALAELESRETSLCENLARASESAELGLGGLSR